MNNTSTSELKPTSAQKNGVTSELKPTSAQKNGVIKDFQQLKNMKFDFEIYGKLPLREHIILFNDEILQKQWDKLRYLRKNLYITNKYLESKSDARFADWLTQNKERISDKVLNQIGDHNNETGGITAYFLNLQQFYDKEEAGYDELEKTILNPEDISPEINELREVRREKRQNRLTTRKLITKDLKKDGKGYLMVDVDEPEAPKENETVNADGEKVQDSKEEINADGGKKEAETQKAITPEQTIAKNKRIVSICIAGTIILISGIAIVAAMKK